MTDRSPSSRATHASTSLGMRDVASWERAEQPPELESGQVHVWRISLAPPDRGMENDVPVCLDAAERQRADRFLADLHRVRFRWGRAAVRCILAAYVARPPRALEFGYTGLGKPFLKPIGTVRSELQFNFSNSADWGLLAVTRHHDVGVDLECVRTLSDMEGLARRFFAPREIQCIEACEDEVERRQIFFRCWTRKEAFLKAVGKGLTFPLDKVCVTSRADEPPRIMWIDENTDEAARWSLHHIDPLPGYVGALAIPTQRVDVRMLDYCFNIKSR